VYNYKLKRKALERKLIEAGWWLKRHGTRHDVWTNGDLNEGVPRHTEIHDQLARKILKVATCNPPVKED